MEAVMCGSSLHQKCWTKMESPIPLPMWWRRLLRWRVYSWIVSFLSSKTSKNFSLLFCRVMWDVRLCIPFSRLWDELEVKKILNAFHLKRLWPDFDHVTLLMVTFLGSPSDNIFSRVLLLKNPKISLCQTRQMLNDFAEGAKHMVLKLEYIQHALLNVASARSVRRLQNTTKWRESELEKDVPMSWPDHCYPQAALTWLLSKSSNLQTRTRVLKWRKKRCPQLPLKPVCCQLHDLLIQFFVNLPFQLF